MSKIEYKYYLLRKLYLARLDSNRYCLEPKEFLKNGVWQYDDQLNLELNDSMMDYGDSSVFDYDEISEEEALNFISSFSSNPNRYLQTSNKDADNKHHCHEKPFIEYGAKEAYTYSTDNAPNDKKTVSCNSFDGLSANEIISILEEQYKDNVDALEVIERSKVDIAYMKSQKDYDGQTPEQYALSLAGHLAYWF